jgi:ComEC/Rec2-related protein
MNRPLVSMVLAYGAGLLLARFYQLPLALLFAVSFAFLGLVLVFKAYRRVLLWPLLLFLGWTNFATHNVVILPDDLRKVLGDEPVIATIRGELVETPHLKIIERNGMEEWRSVALVRVNEIRRDQSFTSMEGKIIVTTPGIPPTNFFAGQKVEVSGVISRPSAPSAEGLFDLKSYLAERDIYFQLKADSLDDWKILAPEISHPPFTDRFLNWSRETLAFGLPEEDEPLRLLWAMTLGWKTAFTGDIDEPFLRAGTMHMFAIDGLRIALLAGIIVTLLGVLRVSRAWSGWIAVPAMWFYTAATGWEPSALRASVMMTVVLGGWAIKRPSDLLNSLAAAALIILVWKPNQLFEASFQLSFFVMLVIGIMLPRTNEFFDRILKHDPLIPDDLVPRWKKLLLWLAHWFVRYCGLSIAAWIGSLPLSAKYFHLFSAISPLANLIAVPLGTAALIANLGALICGHWLPWFTVTFNHAAWFFMVAMQWVSVEATKIPGAYCYVREPSYVTIAIYYAVVIAIFSGWFNTAWRRMAGALVLVLIAAVYLWHWESSHGETRLTVLPASGGHVVYAEGGQNDWLINSGGSKAVQFELKDYLRGQGVNHIPRLILTEGAARECGGVSNLDGLFGIGEVWTSDVKFRSTEYRDTVAMFDKSSRHKILNYGDGGTLYQIRRGSASVPQLPNKNFMHVRPGPDGALLLRVSYKKGADLAKLYWPESKQITRIKPDLLPEVDPEELSSLFWLEDKRRLLAFSKEEVWFVPWEEIEKLPRTKI